MFSKHLCVLGHFWQWCRGPLSKLSCAISIIPIWASVCDRGPESLHFPQAHRWYPCCKTSDQTFKDQELRMSVLTVERERDWNCCFTCIWFHRLVLQWTSGRWCWWSGRPRCHSDWFWCPTLSMDIREQRALLSGASVYHRVRVTWVTTLLRSQGKL